VPAQSSLLWSGASGHSEIAVPLQTKAVTFFFGTGLSKFLTDGVAQSWLELIEDLTKNIDGSRRTLRNNLFNIADDGDIASAKYDLSICAQILELEYRKERRDFKQAVVDAIDKRINEHTGIYGVRLKD